MIKNENLRNNLRRKKYLVKWFFQFHFGKHSHYLSTQKLNISKNTKSLVLAPHADDEWIGTSQILLNTDSTVFYFQFLGNNYYETNKNNRRNEITNIQREVGFKLINSENYEDYSQLENLLEKENFDKIFLPFPIDWHPEHIKVSDILINILEQKPNINRDNLYFYQISVPFPSNLNLEYLPMSKKDLDYKISNFSKYYKSQFNTPITRMSYQLRLNALKKDFYAAECYTKLNFDNWKLLLNYANKNYQNKLKPIANHIDHLVVRKQMADNLYKKWSQLLK